MKRNVSERNSPIPNCGLIWRVELSLDLCALLALGWLVAGCAATKPYEVKEAVGPNQPISARKKITGGALVVYSAIDGLTGGEDPDHEHHTPYTIYSGSGDLLHNVTNRTGSFDQDPLTIALPPGTYKVDAMATHLGRVIVPVVIETGQTTFLYLDGTRPAVPDEGIVRLPNGMIAGWKAGP